MAVGMLDPVNPVKILVGLLGVHGADRGDQANPAKTIYFGRGGMIQGHGFAALSGRQSL